MRGRCAEQPELLGGIDLADSALIRRFLAGEVARCPCRGDRRRAITPFRVRRMLRLSASVQLGNSNADKSRILDLDYIADVAARLRLAATASV